MCVLIYFKDVAEIRYKLRSALQAHQNYSDKITHSHGGIVRLILNQDQQADCNLNTFLQ